MRGRRKYESLKKTKQNARNENGQIKYKKVESKENEKEKKKNNMKMTKKYI